MGGDNPYVDLEAPGKADTAGASGGGGEAPASGKGEHGDAPPSPPHDHAHGHEEERGPNWKGEVLQCCGEGINVAGDFNICMKAMCCPCVYYGQNMRRALVLNGYLHCLVFIVGMDLFWFVGSIMRAKCADPTLPPPSPTRPQHRAAGSPAPPPSPPPLAAIAHYNSCLQNANSKTGYIFIVTLAFMAYAIMRRYQMRKKFGFPHGHWKIWASDVYAWVCCTLCALCQEARTLSYNNVIDGRWLGPAVSLNGLDLASDMERAQATAAEAAAAEGAVNNASSARLAALGAAAYGSGSQYGVAAAGEPAGDGMLSGDSDDD